MVGSIGQQDRKKESVIFGIFVAVFFSVALFFGACRGVFASEDLALRTLETQGYTDVQIVDHTWFGVGMRGCDSSDAAKFTAEATNPSGKRVEVYVCTGAFVKGGTIRVK